MIAAGSVLTISSISMPPWREAMTRTRSVFAVEHVAEIEFALERIGDFDIDALDGLAFRPGLHRHEALAEQLFGGLPNFLIGLAQLDAAGLAARAGMNLRLHDPTRSH